jgi:hypothetical protein
MNGRKNALSYDVEENNYDSDGESDNDDRCMLETEISKYVHT